MASYLALISKNSHLCSIISATQLLHPRFHQLKISPHSFSLFRYFSDWAKQENKVQPLSKRQIDVIEKDSLLDKTVEEISQNPELQKRILKAYEEQEEDPDYQECLKETLMLGFESLSRSAQSDSGNALEFIPKSDKENPQFHSREPFPVGNYLEMKECKVNLLQPGLVVIKQGIYPREQKLLAEEALRLGDDPETGFWKIDKAGNKVLNSKPFRGRIFGSFDAFPELFKRICMRNLMLASHADNTLRYKRPTHLILLYYKTLEQPPKEGYIPWHQDNGENDGDENYPVVSFTIGDSVDFLITNSKPKVSKSWAAPDNLAQQIRFESGDVLVFGGQSRLIWHSVYNIYKDTAPAFLPFQGSRLNFTFRYAPKLLGDEERFATKHMENLAKDNPFYKLNKMK